MGLLFTRKVVVLWIAVICISFVPQPSEGICSLGPFNKGCLNFGLGNRGLLNFGVLNGGVGNAGVLQYGLGNAGVFNFGVMNAGAYNFGRRNIGAHQAGSDNRGIDNIGVGNVGVGGRDGANLKLEVDGAGGINDADIGSVVVEAVNARGQEGSGGLSVNANSLAGSQGNNYNNLGDSQASFAGSENAQGGRNVNTGVGNYGGSYWTANGGNTGGNSGNGAVFGLGNLRNFFLGGNRRGRTFGLWNPNNLYDNEGGTKEVSTDTTSTTSTSTTGEQGGGGIFGNGRRGLFSFGNGRGLFNMGNGGRGLFGWGNGRGLFNMGNGGRGLFGWGNGNSGRGLFGFGNGRGLFGMGRSNLGLGGEGRGLFGLGFGRRLQGMGNGRGLFGNGQGLFSFGNGRGLFGLRNGNGGGFGWNAAGQNAPVVVGGNITYNVSTESQNSGLRTGRLRLFNFGNNNNANSAQVGLGFGGSVAYGGQRSSSYGEVGNNHRELEHPPQYGRGGMRGYQLGFNLGRNFGLFGRGLGNGANSNNLRDGRTRDFSNANANFGGNAGNFGGSFNIGQQGHVHSEQGHVHSGKNCSCGSALPAQLVPAPINAQPPQVEDVPVPIPVGTLLKLSPPPSSNVGAVETVNPPLENI